MTKNRAWKSLLFKVSHLDLEYQDRKELMDQFKIEFDKLVCKEVGTDFYKQKYADESSKELVKFEEIDDQLDTDSINQEEDSNEAEEVKPPASINKLWKLLALKTHPDKNKNDEDLTKIYIDASEAYKEKDYSKLLILALEAGIKIPEDPELIPFVKDNIQILQEKIIKIEKLALWQWIHADDEQKSLIVKLTAEVVKNRNLQSNE